MQRVYGFALACRQAWWVGLSLLVGPMGLRQSRSHSLIAVLRFRLLQIRAETEIINLFQAAVQMLHLAGSGVVLQV